MHGSNGRRLDRLETIWSRAAVSEPPPDVKAAIVAEVAAAHGLDPAELAARIEHDGGPAPLPPLPPGLSRAEVCRRVAEAYGVDPGELGRHMERS